MSEPQPGAQYVCGFLFSEDRKTIALIRKRRPREQLGKWNGIGGKCEYLEHPKDAMNREFREETGVDVPRDDWTRFCYYADERGHYIHFFVAFSDKVFMCSTVTDEQILVGQKDAFDWDEAMPNLAWLIMMAMQNPLQYYRVIEE
jgi:8-oxo-dGTP pyrophosphatase MutT (NUDIX family)